MEKKMQLQLNGTNLQNRNFAIEDVRIKENVERA